MSSAPVARAKQLLLGNEAIAYGLVAEGCEVVTAYPGTPSSEILAGVVRFKTDAGRTIHTEWSTNEKVAFEVALAASWSGLRAAVAMKHVGLNVAADPMFSAAYTGVQGGFLIIPADDPGPHSSQNEQDSRMLALTAKIPVFDPTSPSEARHMVRAALELSEQVSLPVMLRPTTRLCHALQSMTAEPLQAPAERPRTRFRKDPTRWAATPKFRYQLHLLLNEKLRQVEAEFERSPFNEVVYPEADSPVGVIASGVAFHTAVQSLAELGLEVPILKIGTPYPLPRRLVRAFMDQFQIVVVIEESDACIELQLDRRDTVQGRLDGSVPGAGELTPQAVSAVLAEAFSSAGLEVQDVPEDAELFSLVQELDLPARRPQLCPGCAHRSVFFSLKREFGPRAIYPGDIGCYTLGINLRAVDTVLDMGASISMADGFFQASQLTGDARPVVATIGDSTFLHSGVAALINAVHSGARFVLLILDNHTTAMTGFQPTAEADYTADGSPSARRVSIPDIARACGASFVEVGDPYDQEGFQALLKRARDHAQASEGGVAVIVADRPCVLYDPGPLLEERLPVLITEDCDGCRYCLEAFECPALVLLPSGDRVEVDRETCIDCGQCIDACYKGFIVPDFQPGELAS